MSRRTHPSKGAVSIINLTPHPVTILDEDGAVVAEFSSQGIARALQVHREQEPVAGIATTRVVVTRTEGLPAPVRGVLLIVSLITATSAKSLGRQCRDLLIPGPGVRNDAGAVTGCRELVWFE
jgi:hypothetical protein